MKLNINIILSGGLLLFGFLIMAMAAVYDMIDVQTNGPIVDIDPSENGYESSRSAPGTTLFWIGAGSVALGVFLKYKGWGE